MNEHEPSSVLSHNRTRNQINVCTAQHVVHGNFVGFISSINGKYAVIVSDMEGTLSVCQPTAAAIKKEKEIKYDVMHFKSV